MENKQYYADTATTAFEMLEPLPERIEYLRPWLWQGAVEGWKILHASQPRLPVDGMTLTQGQVYEDGKDVLVTYQYYPNGGNEWVDIDFIEYVITDEHRRRIVLVPAVQRDLDTSDNKTEGSSLATLSSSSGNSIEQKNLEDELLIYLTVANKSDNLRLSFIRSAKEKRFVMPALERVEFGDSKIIADNENWMKDTLYPALQRFQRREMQPGDREIINEILSDRSTVYDQLETVSEVEMILRYAIQNDMLNSEQGVQECDATKADSSNVADQQNLPTREEIEREAEGIYETTGFRGPMSKSHYEHEKKHWIAGANYVLSRIQSNQSKKEL